MFQLNRWYFLALSDFDFAYSVEAVLARTSQSNLNTTAVWKYETGVTLPDPPKTKGDTFSVQFY